MINDMYLFNQPKRQESDELCGYFIAPKQIYSSQLLVFPPVRSHSPCASSEQRNHQNWVKTLSHSHVSVTIWLHYNIIGKQQTNTHQLHHNIILILQDLAPFNVHYIY